MITALQKAGKFRYFLSHVCYNSAKPNGIVPFYPLPVSLCGAHTNRHPAAKFSLSFVQSPLKKDRLEQKGREKAL
jgi:hypothetical protein